MSSAQCSSDESASSSKQPQLTKEIELLNELRNQVVLQEKRVQALASSGNWVNLRSCNEQLHHLLFEQSCLFVDISRTSFYC
jgi:hypothetical protein